MAGGKLSARQRMINMMYLVMIALLALNVSKEILKTFHLVELSFMGAGKNLDGKNKTIMGAFEVAMRDRPDEVRPFYDKAKQAQKISADLVKYLDDLKTQLATLANGRAKASEGENVAITELTEPDNIEKHANYFFVENGGSKATEIEKKINDTREAFLKLLDPADRAIVLASTNLKTDDKGEYKSWASKYFEFSPLAGVESLLEKFKNDTKATEAEVIETLAKSIDKSKVSFDKLEAKVIAKSSAVMVGSTYEAEVILVASNSKSDFPVLVGGRQLTMKNGAGVYTAVPSSQGVFSWSGVINVTNNGKTTPYPFNAEYQAFQAGATISADAMNVLYIGLENPISVSVAGYSSNDVSASMSGGSLIRSGKGWVAKVSAPGKATISASAKMKDGSTRVMGSKEYRIKNMPTPESTYGSLVSGTYPAGAIALQSSISATLPNFVFEGVKFSVTKWEALYVPKRGPAQPAMGSGSAISAQLKGYAASAKKGDKILVDNIVAVGPGGVSKRLQPIVLTVQ